jgi:hypothetical protein
MANSAPKMRNSGAASGACGASLAQIPKSPAAETNDTLGVDGSGAKSLL